VLFAKYFGLDYNDKNKPKEYDDYSSNAHAYLIWSLGWPLFYIMNIMIFLFSWLLKKIEKYTN
jgi:hypothetical protein